MKICDFFNKICSVFNCNIFDCIYKMFCMESSTKRCKVEKISDEDLNKKQIFRKRNSYTNLSEEFKEYINEALKEDDNEKYNSKLILSIDDRTPFLQNKKSKSEIREKIMYMETCTYIKCKMCGKEFNNSTIYCMYDNHYCSEQCRHKMLFKK